MLVLIRDPGVSGFAVRPEWYQAKGIGQDPVGRRHRGQALRVALASFQELTAQEDPLKPCLHLIPAEDLLLHAGPWPLHCLS